MSTKHTFLLFCLTSSLLLPGCATLAPPEVPDVVARFYVMRIENPTAGLPSGERLEELRPLLSRRLDGLIRDALEYQARFIAEHPDVPSPDGGPPEVFKPPFVDGDYFTSLFEGPRGFELARVSSTKARWEVTVRFWYPPDAEWADRVVVIEDDGRYVIDDVIYSGAGPFNPAGRLSVTLQAREGAED
jgi:hypothetical protein